MESCQSALPSAIIGDLMVFASNELDCYIISIGSCCSDMRHVDSV